MNGPSVIIYPALFNVPSSSPGNLQLNNLSIATRIQNAAAGSNLSVTIDTTFMGQFPNGIATDGVCVDDLKNGLGQLLSAVPKTDAVAVGLLLADTYKIDDSSNSPYGIMFDSSGSDGSFKPRQGCAVFLDAISPITSGPDNFNQFVAFIALHEVGHAFNLWHTADDSVMQPSPEPSDLGSCDFNVLHKKYLSQAADPSEGIDVMPGGSAFGCRIPNCGAPPGDDNPFAGPAKSDPQLALKIKLSHESFWSFEPIEMDLELALVGSGPTSITLPCEIDPAYESFQIWLTNPRGERRLYQSDFRFCQSNGNLVLNAAESFRRDISLLRELGRATFSTPGTYVIQAMFRLRNKKVIRSNIVRCKVKHPRHGISIWEESKKVLSDPTVQRLLRYKRCSPSERHVKALVSLAKRSSESTASMIHYSLGKAFARSVSRPGKLRSKNKLRERAIVHLEQALKEGSLTIHRRAATRRFLLKMDSIS